MINKYEFLGYRIEKNDFLRGREVKLKYINIKTVSYKHIL